jgi:phosphoribosylformylglycinamidine (FGAM) synthase-like amidotransferase family enzyme
MAAASSIAPPGFDAVDVHMTDLDRAPHCARRLQGPGSVRRVFVLAMLGADAAGRPRSSNARKAKDAFAESPLRARRQFHPSAPVNGCQMLAQLKQLIPAPSITGVPAQTVRNNTKRACRCCWTCLTRHRCCWSHGRPADSGGGCVHEWTRHSIPKPNPRPIRTNPNGRLTLPPD